MNRQPPLPIRKPGSGPLHPAEAAAQTQLSGRTPAVNRSRAPASSTTAITPPAPAAYTATAPLLLAGTSFSIPAASTTGDGYLRSADWDTFNAKEPALGSPGSNGYGLVSTTSGARSWTALEAALGNPATDGFALVSTAAGARSWTRASLQPHAIAAKTAAYTATSADEILTGDATGGAFSITLPTAVGISGRTYTIKRLNSGANAVTVATTGGQTIDGASTVTLTTQWQTLRVVSDGANWLAI